MQPIVVTSSLWKSSICEGDVAPSALASNSSMCNVAGSGGVRFAPTMTGPPTMPFFPTADDTGAGGLPEARAVCGGSDDEGELLFEAAVAFK